LLGNSLDDSSVLSLKEFLNEINKNVPVLLIVDGIDKIDELSFIDNRLGLINGRYDSIEKSVKSYFNGLYYYDIQFELLSSLID